MLLLLDDVFSGLDLRTIEQVAQRLLGKEGYLRCQGITVLFTIHTGIWTIPNSCHIDKDLRNRSEELLPLADAVIRLEDGNAYQDPAVRQSLAPQADVVPMESSLPLGIPAGGKKDSSLAVQTVQPSSAQMAQPDGQKNGSWSVYEYYFTAAGVWTSALFVFWILISSFCGQFPSKSPVSTVFYCVAS